MEHGTGYRNRISAEIGKSLLLYNKRLKWHIIDRKTAILLHKSRRNGIVSVFVYHHSINRKILVVICRCFDLNKFITAHFNIFYCYDSVFVRCPIQSDIVSVIGCSGQTEFCSDNRLCFFFLVSFVE